MSTEIWIPHVGEKRPVPAEALVCVELGPDDRKCSYWMADAWAWIPCGNGTITAFSLDPNQPSQLDGPLAVGNRYIRRDGRIVTVSRSIADWWVLSGRPAMEAVLSDGRVSSRRTDPRDLIARYYGKLPDGGPEEWQAWLEAQGSAPSESPADLHCAPSVSDNWQYIVAQGDGPVSTCQGAVPESDDAPVLTWIARQAAKCKRVAEQAATPKAPAAKPYSRYRDPLSGLETDRFDGVNKLREKL